MASAIRTLIRLYIGSRLFIYVGSHECARELLEKRGAYHSSRPENFKDGIGSERHTVGLPYNSMWQSYRYLLHSLLKRQACDKYISLQDLESKQLLWELLSSSNFVKQFHRFAASTVFALAYGKRMINGDEDEIREVDDIMRNILDKTFLPQVAFPLLDTLPNCLKPWPNATKTLHHRQALLFLRYFQEAKSRTQWNWSKAIDEMHNSSKITKRLDEHDLAYVIGTSYEAGSDTTAFVLEVFVMACVLHPESVKKVQKELDTVVALRLPTLTDVKKLSYTRAFIREILRWRPVVPRGIQRRTQRDDFFMGFKIPKGAVLVPNHWSMEFDPGLFDDPWLFEPDRWISSPDLPSSAFGFGRRQCPGKQLAMNSLAIVICRILWGFEIGPGPDGLQDPFSLTQGISSRPKSFGAIFRPRTQAHTKVIEEEWANCDKEELFEPSIL
ncbi:hypothetical protein HIM_04117 [Hirsutella minnesotensis 3608]|uniref:Cytochrome P450 n=1 Tax=Hirsutella minnesotensis 3608 TaxID=1043627 RepID=A0A0F7ZNU4_9HYPO|nr:hypothetical protein HIM_06361 [Hirsutella minnesotensis 3608]KJZ76388.1 hypothetical protein HIM_04117 [Hirsutella minnesotensis 3608]